MQLNHLKAEIVQNFKYSPTKTYTKQEINNVGNIKNVTFNQHLTPSDSTCSSVRRKSMLEQKNPNNDNSQEVVDKNKRGSLGSMNKQQEKNNINQIQEAYALKSSKHAIKNMPSNNSSSQKKGQAFNVFSFNDESQTNKSDFEDSSMFKQQQQRMNINKQMRQVLPSVKEVQKQSQEQYLVAPNKNNFSNLILSGSQEKIKNNSSYGLFIANSYTQHPKNNQNFLHPINNPRTTHQNEGIRSVSNLKPQRKKINYNQISSLNNINDFEDSSIFQEFQKPQLHTSHNESQYNQGMESIQQQSSQQQSSINSITTIKRDSILKPFQVKPKSSTQLETITSFQKLQKAKQALALGTKVTKFLDILKKAQYQRYDQSSEAYSKECLQILKGILQEKEYEADQFEQMNFTEESSLIDGLDVQKGIKKNTEKLLKKVMRTIQDSIIEPTSSRTYKGLYFDKCKEIERVKFGYKDMEKENEELKKNQQVFDNIAANYFRKTETIEKEKEKLNEDKKTALLEIERLEKKLEESNNYFTFWQGEYHQVNKKYNEEVFTLTQFEEKMKREVTEKIYLENQLQTLHKNIENQQQEFEKVRSAQTQLKWIQESLSTCQQELLNKNIQINICKDILVNKSESLNLLSKEEIDKEQPLSDLIKQLFNSVSAKLN